MNWSRAAFVDALIELLLAGLLAAMMRWPAVRVVTMLVEG